MSEFKDYIKSATQPIRAYVRGEDLSYITVSADDNPEIDGGMIAMNPYDSSDKWFISQKFFDENYVEVKMEKTLHNSTVDGARKNVSDLIVYGNGDTFKLICKASSKAEGWMKSTKAMEIEGCGCIVQVTTQQGDNVSEALTFVPLVKIEEIDGDKSNGRKLVALFPSVPVTG